MIWVTLAILIGLLALAVPVAAVLGVIEALFDAAEIAHQEGGAHLAAAAAGKLSLEHIQQHAAHALEELQQHVAGEAVAHHHIKFA